MTQKDSLQVLVLGGYGAVGRHATNWLRKKEHKVVSAGRDPLRADLILDLSDTNAVTAAASQFDIVLNASGREDVDLVKTISSTGTAFVDIGASSDYLQGLQKIETKAPVLVSVGIAPGLTNLMTHALAEKTSGDLDIAIVLGAGEKHGAAGAKWMYSLFGESFSDPASGQQVRNYSKAKTFVLPTGKRSLYRTNFSDQATLTEELSRPIRTYFGLDSTLVTGLLAGLTWVPGSKHLPTGLPLPGSEDWQIQVSDQSGTALTISGRGQSYATGIMAGWAVEKIAGEKPGLSHLNQIATFNQVLEADLPPFFEVIA